jgi:hypothetical protein
VLKLRQQSILFPIVSISKYKRTVFFTAQLPKPDAKSSQVPAAEFIPALQEEAMEAEAESINSSRRLAP